MKLLTQSLAAALTLALGGAALAFDGAAVNAANAYHGYAPGGAAAGGACGDPCGGCYDACNTCCDDPGWGLFGEAELLFLRYHRADGIRIGTGAGEAGEFDFDPAFRFSLGAISPSGIGFRARYFEFDHFEPIEDPGDGIGVDTYNLDFELFEAFELNPNWAVEVSGGVRYNNFHEDVIDLGEYGVRSVGSDSFGIVTGLEARRAIGIGLLYARARLAVVQGDKDVVDPFIDNGAVRLPDSTFAMTELAIGSEVNYELANGSVLFARSGLEWQHWENFSTELNLVENDPLQLGIPDEIYAGASDVGFVGFTLSLGMSY